MITFGLFGIAKFSSGSFVRFFRLLEAGSSISTRCKSSIPENESNKKLLKKKRHIDVLLKSYALEILKINLITIIL